jgi:23S rRNA (guanosine2251-2'-O)-methyltransferase
VERPAFRGRPERAEEGKRVYGRPAPERESTEPAYKRYEYKPAIPAAAPAAKAEESIDPMENLLSGRNPIREAIKSGRDIEKLLVAKGDLSGSAREIVAMAREARIPVQEVDRARLDEITRHHQGMLAFASAYQYATVEDMLAEAREKGEDPFLILLDGITDPHNLGAVIRTAECVGAHGVIVPERRSVGLTPAAVKASAGAVEHVKVARVGNLSRTLEDLQKAGLWIAAAVTDGEDYQKADLNGPLALVIGSEGEGISRLVLEHCDKTVALPMKGKIGSLNASVAAGIMMYAVLAARNKG